VHPCPCPVSHRVLMASPPSNHAPTPLLRVPTALLRRCPAGDTSPCPQGEKSFFLQPGERLQAGIQDVYVLSEDEGLLLQALQTIKDTNEVAQGTAGVSGSPVGIWEKLGGGIQGGWDEGQPGVVGGQRGQLGVPRSGWVSGGTAGAPGDSWGM